MSLPTETSPNLTAGFLFAFASAALFAIRPVVVKLVYAEGVDPTTLIAFRMLFSMPIYLFLLWYFLRKPELQGRLNVRNMSKIFVVGMLGYYAASFLDLLGLQYVSAQLGRMILYIYPTLVVLLGALLFSQKITARIVMSLVITYFGIALIFGHDLSEFGAEVITGALFILGSAFSFALYLVFGKDLISEVGSRLFTCIALLSASIGILVHYALTHGLTAGELNINATGLIFFIAIFCTVIPTFFTTAAVARIGAERTGIIATIGPAFTSIAAVAVLNEAFTKYHAAGILLTMLGIGMLRERKAKSIANSAQT